MKGFRFDVVNLISKPETFEDDHEGDGRRFYSDGPRVHEFLKELVADTEIGDMITVGEMSSTSLDNCIRYSIPKEKELTMCFNFYHLKVDYKDGNKWELMKPDYHSLKELFEIWQTEMEKQNGWNAVFWCNHDQPRIVSRLGDERRYWKESAKMLATCIHMLRGTPYIYQGEELGMTNAGYKSIGEYRDVESIHYYEILRGEGKTDAEALEILGERSRDNSRTPMQWDSGEFAGFSESAPWIGIPDNYRYINAETEEEDSDSILNYYRKLIQIRKEYPIVQKGRIAFLYQEQSEIFAYKRSLEGQELLVLNNLTDREAALPEPVSCEGCQWLIGNYPQDRVGDVLKSLKPYESIVLLHS